MEFCSNLNTSKLSVEPEKAQNKPFTWRNKEVKRKFHNDKNLCSDELGRHGQDQKIYTLKLKTEHASKNFKLSYMLKPPGPPSAVEDRPPTNPAIEV